MTNYSVCRVIKIIDEYSIVINGGLDDSISKGDEIDIFMEGDVLIDPFNDNRELGTLDFIKDTLEVVEVYRNFSVCQKFEEKEIYTPSAMERALEPTLRLTGQFKGSTQIKKIRKTIEIDEEEKSGRVKGDSTIKIGDLARIAVSG